MICVYVSKGSFKLLTNKMEQASEKVRLLDGYVTNRNASQQPSDRATMVGNSGDQSVDSGQSRLKELGYKQELKRDLSSVSSLLFCLFLNFSFISKA